jgi:predicted DsbA family dithiol-disulfide isomerase
MDFENALAVNTLTAHRLLRLAEHEYGGDVQRALVRKLFEAHFEHAADISDHATLTSVAASVDLNPVRVRGYLGSNEGLQETRAELALSLERGIRAVPTFVCQGRYAFEGAQPASTLLRALEELTAREFEAPSVPDDAG